MIATYATICARAIAINVIIWIARMFYVLHSRVGTFCARMAGTPKIARIDNGTIISGLIENAHERE